MPGLPHQNRSSHVDYRQAYTPELAAMAARRYERDIYLFDYTDELNELLQNPGIQKLETISSIKSVSLASRHTLRDSLDFEHISAHDPWKWIATAQCRQGFFHRPVILSGKSASSGGIGDRSPD